jgi:sugar phosphate isomerase/epimerase
MRFGFCAGGAHSETIRSAGYDYIELPLAPTLRPEEPEAEVMPAALRQLGEWPGGAQAFNILLPGDLKVVGPEVDEARQERYLSAAFARVGAVGGSIAVFGSGRSRAVPDGFSRETARSQIIAFLQRCGPQAAASGVTVAIEPLNTRECNILTSVAAALEIAQAAGHPQIKVLSDLYHVAEERQSYEETRAAGDWLAHVHVAGAEGRRVPNAADIDYLAAYFRVLKEMGYAGRISVEGSSTDLPRQAGESLDALHKAWQIA